MTMMACDGCKAEISKQAKECPKCGHPIKSAANLSGSQIVSGLVFSSIVLWFYFDGGLEQQAAKNMQQIENQVASDSVKQYDIAKTQGDKMQICVQAGIVSAAYLQAKDEPNYQQCKKREQIDCAKAGIPH